MQTYSWIQFFWKQWIENTLSFSEIEVEIGQSWLTAASWWRSPTSCRTRRSGKRWGKFWKSSVPYPLLPMHTLLEQNQEVQARKNIFACRCKRQQNCTTPILTSPSTSSSTWPGVLLSLDKKNMRIAAVAEKVDVKLSLTVSTKRCHHWYFPSSSCVDDGHCRCDRI